jgi:predicted methyltransferase
LSHPVLTHAEHAALVAARAAGQAEVTVSLDLGRTRTVVTVHEDAWSTEQRAFPYLASCKENTIYYWSGDEFLAAARFAASLIKLVPTTWGPPTFHIDGVKMLPTAKVCPFADAGAKVELIQPRGKVILDTCGGLGYFASWCIAGQARRIQSYEVNPDVAWLRTINPWSPPVAEPLRLNLGDVSEAVATLASASFDAVLHDPPRIGLAGELYSQAFYDQLARVLKPGGRLFHYTGAPNRLTTGRNVPNEVTKRLVKSGMTVTGAGDGLLAINRSASGSRRRAWVSA